MGRRWRRRIGGAAAALSLATAGMTAAVVAVGVAPAGATTYTVTNTADSGADSLRNVLESQVVDGDTVELVAGATYQLTDCKAGDIDIAASVTIEGNGATIQQTCSDGTEDGVLYTEDDLVLKFVTITGGMAYFGGGGVYSESGRLTIYGSTITGNVACDNGGGIHTHEGLFVSNSTISDNLSTDDGGAIAEDTDAAGDITVYNSTITANTGGEVGGIENDYGNTYLVYTTLADNTTDPTASCPISPTDTESSRVHAHSDVGPQDEAYPANIRVDSTNVLHSFASVIAMPHGGPNCGDFNGQPLANTESLGYNFADDTSCDLTESTDTQVAAADPMLGSLAANGGPTLTMLPQAGSPLLDAIPLDACSNETVGTVADDQRFLPRPDVVNQKCDIGAVEVQTEAPVELQPTFTG